MRSFFAFLVVLMIHSSSALAGIVMTEHPAVLGEFHIGRFELSQRITTNYDGSGGAHGELVSTSGEVNGHRIDVFVYHDTLGHEYVSIWKDGREKWGEGDCGGVARLELRDILNRPLIEPNANPPIDSPPTIDNPPSQPPPVDNGNNPPPTTPTVPEPKSYILFGLGMSLLAFKTWKSRRS